MGAAGWVPGGTAVQTAAIPLQRLAAEKGLVFGSCLALKYCVQSAAYQQLFLSQCDIATPELHMKWNSLSSQPDMYNFSNADKFVTFSVLTFAGFEPNRIAGTLWVGGLSEFALQGGKSRNAFHRVVDLGVRRRLLGGSLLQVTAEDIAHG